MNLYNLHKKPEKLHKQLTAKKEVVDVFWDSIKWDKDELKRHMKFIEKSPKYSYLYAEIIDDEFLRGEAAIATSAKYSYLYALYVLEGRFEQGEAAIAKDGYLSFSYADDVIKGRWKPGELAILKLKNYSLISMYSTRVMQVRWREGETALLADYRENDEESEGLRDYRREFGLICNSSKTALYWDETR